VSDNDAYARAGVSYASIDPGKLRAQRAAAATASGLGAAGLSEVAESRGESAYVIDFGDHYLSTVTEALGTKNLVADAVRPLTGHSHYDDVARDTVATVLNDLCTVGGTAVSLTAYWGAGSSAWFEDQERMADLVDGWSAACKEAGCSWGGGETQVLPSMIEPGTAVLGGSAVGIIRPKQRLLLGSRVRPGDAILIAPATGIHANGLTLARQIAAGLKEGYATPLAGDAKGRCYGEVLLDPAPLYGPLVAALQDGGLDLHYAVHVTGHGWRKLMRASQPLTYVIERLPPVPPIFDFVVRAAGMSPLDAYGTFNMGGGFAVFLPAADAGRAAALARQRGFDLLVAGRVDDGPKRVVLQPLGLNFEGESLQIR
jgi:phosphoribosylformylglycinamidine cyclo-ligase